jgi:exonuclease 3'-5' domain-containing protein 1
MFVERNGPKHVEELLEAVTKSYPRESWVNLFSTSHDLTTFFKLHSNIFHVQANIVDIIPYNLRKAAESHEAPVVNKTVEPSSFSPPPSLQFSHEKQSLKQRVNSIVMKTLAENTGRDRTPAVVAGHESPTKEITSPSKMRVLQSTRVISSTKESIIVVNDIMSSQKVVSLDLEGVNVGGNNGEVILNDPNLCATRLIIIIFSR